MITLIKILLYGVLATVSAKVGISIFYLIFPPESYSSIDHLHAITAAIVGAHPVGTLSRWIKRSLDGEI